MAFIKQADYKLNRMFGQGVSVYSIIRCIYGKRLTSKLTRPARMTFHLSLFTAFSPARIQAMASLLWRCKRITNPPQL